jgi:SP family sugar:H+ symporter-like MFS transporter
MKFFSSKRQEHAAEGEHLERRKTPDTDGRITFLACFMGLVASVSPQTPQLK